MSFPETPAQAQAANRRALKLRARLCGSSKRVFIPEFERQMEERIRGAGSVEHCLQLVREFAADLQTSHLNQLLARLAELDHEEAAQRDLRGRSSTDILLDTRFGALSDLVARVIPSLGTNELTAAMEAVGRLGGRPSGCELLRGLLDEVTSRVKRMSPGQIVRSMHALACTGHLSTRLMVSLIKRAEREMILFEPEDLCSLMYYLGRLRHLPAPHVLAAVIAQAHQRLPGVSLHSIARLLRGCAMLEYSPDKLLRAVVTRLKSELSTVKPGLLCDLLSSMARLEWNPARALDALVLEALGAHAALDLQDTAALLSATAKVCRPCSQAMLRCLEPVTEGCDRFRSQISHSPGTATTLAWALAALGQQPSAELFEGFSQVLERHSSQFGSQQLASMLWSLVSLHKSGASLSEASMSACTEMATSEAIRKMGDVNARGISMLLSAYSKRFTSSAQKEEAYAAHLDTVIEMLLEAASRQLHSFKPAAVAALCGSLAALMEAEVLEDPDAIDPLMEAALRQMALTLECFEVSEVLCVVCGFAASVSTGNEEQWEGEDDDWTPPVFDLEPELEPLLKLATDTLTDKLSYGATNLNPYLYAKLAWSLGALELQGTEQLMQLLSKRIDKCLGLLSLTTDEFSRLMQAYGRMGACPPALAAAMAAESERHLPHLSQKHLREMVWACRAVSMSRLQRRLEMEQSNRAQALAKPSASSSKQPGPAPGESPEGAPPPSTADSGGSSSLPALKASPEAPETSFKFGCLDSSHRFRYTHRYLQRPRTTDPRPGSVL